MPCDICGHTVQNIGAIAKKMWWCPRCGSLKSEVGEFSETAVPTLVQRVKAVDDTANRMPAHGFHVISWQVGHIQWMAVREAIGHDPHRGEGGS